MTASSPWSPAGTHILQLRPPIGKDDLSRRCLLAAVSSEAGLPQEADLWRPQPGLTGDAAGRITSGQNDDDQ